MLNRMLILISLISLGFSNVFISEAAEGSSNNKYLEFYNAGTEVVDLTEYAFPNVGNEPSVPGEYEYWNAFDDGSTVAPGDVFVVCHPDADAAIDGQCDQTFTYLSNGDDGFCLVHGNESSYTVLDCVGDWNGDPGSGWAVCGDGSTQDHTLVRKSSVMQGNGGDWNASAGTNGDDCEWVVFDQNTWDNLGFHEMDSTAYTINAGSYYYNPSVLTIMVGETVKWVNDGGFHDVVATSGPELFSLPACSGPCDIGEYTFTLPGTYEYICSIGSHEDLGMVGTIIVDDIIVLDCEDETACNFMEPGECVYPEENFDCDGNCTVDTDCNGVCGGDAVVDDCGECGGNGSSCAEIANLFYSEWAEGSSNNKYLEIYNASDATVSLGAYAMGTVGNAPDVPGEYEYWNTFDEGAEVAAGDVFVICHPDADATIAAECDQTFTYLSNGDDGNCLVFGSEDNYTVVDCIGNWEADPGDGWDVAGVYAATKDHTIVRKPNVTSGTGYDWATSAGTNVDDSQWSVFEQNTWDNVGYHATGVVICEDEAACNFGEEATCEYAEENYDCEGNCTAEIDECGECGGDGSSCAPADNLFFSEVAEGSSNNKYLEIFNATDGDVDLSAYSLSSCSNGCDEPGSWDYPNNVTFEDAVVASGDVYVVCNPSADEYILNECDQTFTYLSNGDDVFALTQISTGNVLDVIGIVGEDPGAGWDVAGVDDATKDHTLVRKSSVTSGNPLWLDNPDTGEQGSAGDDAEDSEWIVLDIDTWDYLGFHDMDGGSIPECAQDCQDINLIDGSCDNFGGYDDSPECMNNACEIIITWGNCFDDCDAEILCEAPFELLVPACEYCLVDGSCDDLDSALCEVGLDSYIDDCVEDGFIPDDWEGVCEEEECQYPGDVNSDGILNVLDVVQIVSAIVDSATDGLECADMNGDGIINVLDIVQIVSAITGGRFYDADSATLDISENMLTLKSNGYIGGVQLTLEHNQNFELNLTSDCMVSDYKNYGTYSIVLIVEPKSETLFTTNSKFEISDIIVANSNEQVKVFMMNDFSLSNAYPNPFNPSTSFSIDIPNSGYLNVKVFNVSGQLVDVLSSGFVNADRYDFTWDAHNMAAGVYVINAEFEGKSISHNISLIK